MNAAFFVIARDIQIPGRRVHNIVIHRDIPDPARTKRAMRGIFPSPRREQGARFAEHTHNTRTARRIFPGPGKHIMAHTGNSDTLPRFEFPRLSFRMRQLGFELPRGRTVTVQPRAAALDFNLFPFDRFGDEHVPRTKRDRVHTAEEAVNGLARRDTRADRCRGPRDEFVDYRGGPGGAREREEGEGRERSYQPATAHGAMCLEDFEAGHFYFLPLFAFFTGP